MPYAQGMAAPLVGVTPMYAICFLGYGIGQDLQRSSPDQKVCSTPHYHCRTPGRV